MFNSSSDLSPDDIIRYHDIICLDEISSIVENVLADCFDMFCLLLNLYNTLYILPTALLHNA